MAGSQRLRARHAAVNVLAVVAAASVRVGRGWQPFRQGSRELAHKPAQTLTAPLPIGAVGARTPAAGSAVADPLEDLERLIELLALVAEQLAQLTALLLG